MSWDLVEEWLPNAKAITWDTCHKIYVLMDDEQVAEMREIGYDPIYLVKDLGTEAAFQTLGKWFQQSCGLRFINAVATNHEDPNAGFTNLIAQFEGEDEDEDDTPMCGECGWHEVDEQGDTCRWCEPEDEEE